MTPPTQEIRAAIYSRVSQDNQAGRSVSEQEAESRAACEANGWTIEQTYIDNDVSASRFTTKARPAWARLVADLDDGKVDVLVLWEPSRGSRELVTWAALLDACRRRHVRLHVTSHGHTYDLARPRDWRSLADDGVDSAYESDKASQRIKRAVAANRVAGRPHGRVPYGYARRYDPATKRLVAQEPDPVTAPIVREIVARIGASEPVSVVAADLNARGIPGPHGGAWARQVVRRTALARAYNAEIEHDGEIHKAVWESLVTPAAFYAARRVLLDPRRTVTKPGKYKHLLSYVATCQVCGAGLQAAPRKGRPTYFCPAGHVSVGAGWLDDLVAGVVLARLAQDEDLTGRLAGGDDAAVLAARDDAAVLRGRLDEFRDSAAAGELTAASLAHVETRLLADIAAAERRAQAAATPAVLRGLAGPDVAARWAGLSVAARRKIIDTLLTVSIGRANGHGRHAGADFDRVKIEWRH